MQDLEVLVVGPNDAATFDREFSLRRQKLAA